MAAGTDNSDGTDAEKERLPGAPVPDDELDPELIALPRPKTRVGPILSLSIVLLSVILLVKLWPDFRFGLTEQPENFETVERLLEAGQANAFVAVRAVPDLTVGALVRKGRGAYGHRIQPVFGSNGNLWLMTHSYHWHAKPAYSQVYTGRLAVLGDLPFYEKLSSYWASKDPAKRVIGTDALRSALAAKSTTVEVVGGDEIPLGGETVLEISETVPGRAQVTAYYTEDLPDERTWTLALEQAGLRVVGGRSLGQGDSGETFLYDIEQAGGAAATSEILTKTGLYAARAVPMVREHRVTASEIAAEGSGLRIGDELVSWSSIDLVRVANRYPVPADARVIIATDRPESYWYVNPVMILLLLSGLLFAFVFARYFLARR